MTYSAQLPIAETVEDPELPTYISEFEELNARTRGPEPTVIVATRLFVLLITETVPEAELATNIELSAGSYVTPMGKDCTPIVATTVVPLIALTEFAP